MRYLGMNDFQDIYRMTLYEYSLRMRAFRLRQVDEELSLHLLAWECWNVQAMKKKGNDKRVPYFQTFNEFYDYEARLKEVTAGKTMDTPDKTNVRNRAIEMMRMQEKRGNEDGEL